MQTQKVAAVALVLLATIVSVAVSVSAKGDTFQACDGFEGPIGEVSIDRCPDAANVGYCELKFGTDPYAYEVTFNFTFTPATISEDLVTRFRVGEFNFGTISPSTELPSANYLSSSNGDQKIQMNLNFAGPLNTRSGERTAQLNVHEARSGGSAGNLLYCVKFPVRIQYEHSGDGNQGMEGQSSYSDQLTRDQNIVPASTSGTKDTFERCDGFEGPIGKVSIDACPDAAKVGFCELDLSYSSLATFKFTFTPATISENLVTRFRVGEFNYGYNRPSTKPLSAIQLSNSNEEQTIQMNLDFAGPLNRKSGMRVAQFNVYEDGPDRNLLYCVAFPVYIRYTSFNDYF